MKTTLTKYQIDMFRKLRKEAYDLFHSKPIQSTQVQNNKNLRGYWEGRLDAFEIICDTLGIKEREDE